MKTRCIPLWLALLGLLCVGQLAHAQLPAGMSGAWYNPAQSGHGLSVEIHSATRAIVFWMVYDPDGNPVHLYIDGQVGPRSIAGRAYLSRGMRFGSFDRSEFASELWGDVALEFEDCDTAELHYDANGPAGAGYGEGSLPLQRLIGLHGQSCNFDLQMVGLFDGELTNAAGRSASVVGLFSDDGEVMLIVDSHPGGRTPRDVVFRGRQSPRADTSGQPVEVQLVAANGRESPPIAEANLVVPLQGVFRAQLQLQPQSNGSQYIGVLRLADGREFAIDIAPRQLFSTWTIGSFPAAYQRSLSLRSLVGSYHRSFADIGGLYYKVEFSLSPVLGGDNFTGKETDDLWGSTPQDRVNCDYSGRLLPRNDRVAEVEVDVTISNCGARNGRYLGRGWIEDRHNEGDNGVLHIIAFGKQPGQGLRLFMLRRP